MFANSARTGQDATAIKLRGVTSLAGGQGKRKCMEYWKCSLVFLLSSHPP